jgi:hypothetical protein
MARLGWSTAPGGSWGRSYRTLDGKSPVPFVIDQKSTHPLTDDIEDQNAPGPALKTPLQTPMVARQSFGQV